MENMKINIPRNFSVEEVVDFKFKINEIINSGTVNFIFDFSKCDFIDSTGLGELVSIYKRCIEKGGSLTLKMMNPEVRDLFRLTRLNKVFYIE